MDLKEELKLTVSERALMLALRKDEDVSIDTLFKALYGSDNRSFPRARRQNYIGSHISRINKKLTDAVIRPGDARYSYRLQAK